MKYRKLLTSAILVSAICLITVLVLTTEKAEAWSWTGFSELCVDDAYRGRAGVTIDFTITDATIIAQCYNTNTDNDFQPGIGNGGTAELTTTTFADPSKKKGIVSVYGCVDMSRWDDHTLHTDHPEDHICFPYDNKNKEELLGTAYFQSFKATWYMYNEDGDVINEGIDICVWDGELINGYPTHDAFTCTSTSDKKINFYNE